MTSVLTAVMDSPRPTLSGMACFPCSSAEGAVMNRKRIAVDLAKSVFQVAESILPGKVSRRLRVSRTEFGRYLTGSPNLQSCSWRHVVAPTTGAASPSRRVIAFPYRRSERYWLAQRERLRHRCRHPRALSQWSNAQRLARDDAVGKQQWHTTTARAYQPRR